MKNLKDIILEKLQIDKATIEQNSKDLSYIDDLPKGKEKTEAIYEIIADRYEGMFENIRVNKADNINLGFFTDEYKIPNGKHNDAHFVFYIYDNDYIIRKGAPNSFGSPGVPTNYVEKLRTFAATLDKFEQKLRKAGYKFPKDIS